MRHVFWGIQLGYIDRESPFLHDDTNLAMVWHSSKNWNMDGDKMVLIAQPLLESNIGPYIEWLVNELMITANKT
jgi:hypothetical protein